MSHPVAGSTATSADWTQFRGPGGQGKSDEKDLPFEWSSQNNIVWKLTLPGAGASCPVVLGKRVYVTCYSGYGTGEHGAGRVEALRRHLVCIDRAAGRILWTRTVNGGSPEDDFNGYLTEHGYASNTPTSNDLLTSVAGMAELN